MNDIEVPWECEQCGKKFVAHVRAAITGQVKAGHTTMCPYCKSLVGNFPDEVIKVVEVESDKKFIDVWCSITPSMSLDDGEVALALRRMWGIRQGLLGQNIGQGGKIDRDRSDSGTARLRD